MRRLGNYGARAGDHYHFEEPGLNSRLDPLQAAALRIKLRVLDEWNERRRRLADAYRNGLAGVPELTLPAAAAGSDPVWHLFCVRHPRRDGLATHLAARSIATQIHYPEPPHRSAAFADLGYSSGSFPVCEAAAGSLLSLPIGPHLSSGGLDLVIDAVRAFSGG